MVSIGLGLIMNVTLKIGEPKSRHRVLLLAAACNPYKSSESGVGWGRAVQTARHFETWVICGHWDQPDIDRYLTDHGEIPGLHFYFLERSWLEGLLMRGQPFYEIHYFPHFLWHLRAYRLAANLHQELKFALTHHVSRTGFREPGYLWKLDAPFIWGPVGGTQNYPWRFLIFAGVCGAIKEGFRSMANSLQFRFSPRVRKAIRKATFLIAANSEIQRDFARVHGINPAVLLETGLKKVENGWSKKFRQDVPLRILWSGRLKHHKALHLLFYSLPRLPSGLAYEVKILGKGPLKKQWQNLGKRLGIDSQCQWLGWVSHEVAMKEYDWADVVVFTSLRDTSSNVVLEALSRGVPVICLDHQGVGDIVTDDCGLKIPVTNPEKVIKILQDIICGLIEDKTKLHALSLGAINRARNYLWSSNVEEMTKIYVAILGKTQTCSDLHSRSV
jgi:glycosyltransferase involved in cell wall biosynthesis